MVGKDDTEKQAEASQEEDEEVEDDGWISQQSDDHRHKALDVGLQLRLDDPYLRIFLLTSPASRLPGLLRLLCSLRPFLI
jgi:hypothetical protein